MRTEFVAGDLCRFVLTGDKCMVVNVPLLDSGKYDVRLFNGEIRRVYPCEIEAWVEPKPDTKKADSIIDQLKEYAKKFNKQYGKKKTNSWIRDPWDFEEGPKVIPMLGK